MVFPSRVVTSRDGPSCAGFTVDISDVPTLSDFARFMLTQESMYGDQLDS